MSWNYEDDKEAYRRLFAKPTPEEWGALIVYSVGLTVWGFAIVGLLCVLLHDVQ